MAVDLFDLPHILEAIVAPLRFNDLVNCVRVNRTWYNTITPLLWEDVITYRSQATDRCIVWTYQQYFFRDEQSCEDFRKNAHHIRALTCRTQQLLTTLNTTYFPNLVEINLVTDLSCDAFPALIRLIARSPKLRAVSVENPGTYATEKDWEHAHDLVDVLCKFPEISCVYLDGIYSQARDIEGLCTKLLGRIKKNTNQIKKLTVQRPDLLARSRRGPSRGRAWTSRESPLVVPVPSTDMWRIIEDNTEGNNGRWENEQWMPMLKSGWNTIAIMEREDELQVVLPSTFPEDAYIRFLDQFSDCQDVSLGDVQEPLQSALAAFLWRLPKMHKVDLPARYFRPLNEILGNDNFELTSVRLHTLKYTTAFTLSDMPLWTRLSGLVDLDLDFVHVTITELLQVLASTTQLQTIRVPSVKITGKEKGHVPGMTWASSSLRQVSLGLYLNGHDEELLRGYGQDWGSISSSDWANIPTSDWSNSSAQDWDDILANEDDKVQACTTKIATALAPVFMAHLDAQAELRELELSFNNRLYPRLSPFLQLSLDPVMGLPRLSNLKKLEKLVITGLVHQLGQQEIEWMSQHWPKLSWIEVPILNTYESLTETRIVSCNRQTFSGQAPAYHQWFPQLHVAIPVDCYSCAQGCNSMHCLCRSLYEAHNIAMWGYDDNCDDGWGFADGAYWHERVIAARKTVEVAREATLIDPFDNLYLGRHRQHESASRPKAARGSRL
ncbi:hypothetical protein BGZ81_003349 [Podila clonocystis]|nr:hypothetical protein BGZ81_003349 [Podila clonocystis]